MVGERRIDRAVAGLAGVITAVIVLVVARPYDGAMFRSAASGTTWTEHLVRVRAALLRAEGADASTWLAAADYEFPPLIHWVAIPLGDLFGRSPSTVERFGLLWLVVLAVATTALAFALSRDRVTAALAGSLVAMIPAVHGTALGYYYDLPMTAWLWAAASALALWGPTRPVLGGITAGIAFVLACLGKWTALVLAPPLVLGVLLISPAWRRSVASAGIAAAVAGIGVAGVLSFTSTSLQLQLRNSYGVETGDGGSGLGGVVQTVLGAGGAPFGETLWFLSVRLVLGAVGPLFAALLLAASGFWLWRSRVGLKFVAVVVVADVLLIAWLFPALNDRWLVSMVPVLAVIAALGLREVPQRARTSALALAIVIGLATTWDFHHGESQARAAVEARSEADWNSVRSWGAASSSEPPLGWARGDYLQKTFLENREWLWAEVVWCGAHDVLLEDPGVVHPEDDPWWQYRDILHHLDTGHELHHIATLSGRQLTDPESHGDRKAVALLLADRTAEMPSPAELLPGWERRTVVEGWSDSLAVGFWTPKNSAVCR
jgi:hypothetical protein